MLEISNSRDAAARLDPDERDDVGITDAIGRDQQATIINESGLRLDSNEKSTLANA